MTTIEISRSPARSSAWPIAGLLVFSAMPLTFGVLRILQLTGLSALMPPVPGNLGFVVPLVTHIVSAFVFAVLGAFQFSPAIRRRWPVWHRLAGKLAWYAGLLVALSALWLTLDYARLSLGGILLAALRLAVAAAMLFSLVQGLATIRRHDIPHHREWMLRAYALGLGSATQMLVLTVAEMTTGGPPSEVARAVLMGLAWAINIAFAEWLIRRTRPRGMAGRPNRATAPRRALLHE